MQKNDTLNTRKENRGRAVPASARGGFTMVEVLLASLVLVIAILGTMSSITSSAVLGDASLETTVAYKAAQQQMERLKATAFANVFTEFNGDPTDDVGGNGTAPGANFAVAGLDPQRDDAAGMVGVILLPVSDAQPGRLIETFVDDQMGMPRDLNVDGVVDAADHSADYFILPVRVRIEWRGLSGNRTIELNTILSGR